MFFLKDFFLVHVCKKLLVFGTEEKPKSKKRKRARKKDGTFKGDDKSTPNVNEAWENE